MIISFSKLLVTIACIAIFISCDSSDKSGNIKSTEILTPIQPNNEMDNFEYSLKSAHPKAQALMKEEFYWSPIEETAPFGSDDGSEAAYGFRPWRLLNKTSSPVNYVKETIEGWGYAFFDYNEMDTVKIKAYLHQTSDLSEASIQQKIHTLKQLAKDSPGNEENLDDDQLRKVVISTNNAMNGEFLLGQDNAIIATGFAQFVTEGYIDSDLHSLAITAIKRQLLPLLLNRYDIKYRDIRKYQLTKMLEVINQADHAPNE